MTSMSDGDMWKVSLQKVDFQLQTLPYQSEVSLIQQSQKDGEDCFQEMSESQFNPGSKDMTEPCSVALLAGLGNGLGKAESLFYINIPENQNLC